MKRLSVRLVLSHLVVALVGVAATYVVVRLLAPVLFDQTIRMGQGPNASGPGMAPGGPGMAQGGLRTQVSAAIDSAVLVGALVGGAAAMSLGAFIGWRLARPLRAVRDATRAIADGRYGTALPQPGTTELADLTHDVARLGQTLAATESRRLRLLGDVAHELRTPITVLDGTIEAMIDGVLPLDPEQLTTMSGEVRRLRRLSDDLSQLSRADEGRLEIQPARGNLSHTVAAAAERLRPQADDAGVELQVSGTPVEAAYDADRIAQVVTNLVGNAIRATPAGGRIEVSTHARDGWAQMCVTDTGVGLSAEDCERVFERFYRVDRSSDGGSGVGLTIARRLVEAHGGTLAATSPGVGQGSTFSVRLPLSA